MAKLLTHHDPYHIHAIIGLLNLINIVVRMFLLILDKDDIKDSGFGYNPYLDMASIFLMCLPNVSSFIFTHTPTLKIRNDGFTIWKEYRAHATIFGLRSCFVLAIQLYEKYCVPDGIPGMRFIKIATVMTSLFLAKTVTDSFPKQESTIRGMYKTSLSVAMAGFVQFLSNAGIMLGMSPADDNSLQFAIATAIQLNAFNMTLRKKRISGPIASQIFYSCLLSLGFYLFVFRRFWAEPPTGFLDDRVQFLYAAVIAYACRRSGFDRFSSWITALIAVSCLYNDASLLPGLMLPSKDSPGMTVSTKVSEFLMGIEQMLT